MPETEAVEKLVARIIAARTEYANLSRKAVATLPGGPASESSIRKAEARLGRSFPSDYRAFLMLHDGWAGFVGESDILSTGQILGGDMHARSVELKAQMRSEGDKGAARGFNIQASLFNWGVVYFDVEKKRADGGLDVVIWEHGDQGRFRSFLAYLQNRAKIFEAMLADERALKRPSKKKKR
jgi:hypothetical protein